MWWQTTNHFVHSFNLWKKKQQLFGDWIVLLSLIFLINQLIQFTEWLVHDLVSGVQLDASVWGKTEKLECTLLRNNIFILKRIILLNANRIAGFSHSYQVNKKAQSETHTHTYSISFGVILRLCNTDKGYFWPRAVVANLWPLGKSR